MLRSLTAGALVALLSIVATPAALAQAPDGGTYTVRAGDTLYRIAATHGMNVDELKALNGLTSNTIRVGQELDVYLPPGTAPDSVVVRDTTLNIGRVRSYTVREGETLYSIAAEIGTKAYLLHALNDEVRDPLEPGREILVPADPEGRNVYAAGEAVVFPDTYAGRTMAGGEAYDPASFVASHPDLPMDTVLLIEHRAARRATFARVADRGPAAEDALIEISRAAADELQLEAGDVVHVWLVE